VKKDYESEKIRASILEHEVHVLERFHGDRAFLREIYTVFLSEIPEKSRLLQEAEASLDYESIAELAHALRSSGATIGVEACSDLAARMEDAAWRKKGDEVSRLNAELGSVMNVIASVIEERLTAI
jgi:HPt (histidine-containing phosphotransfer) domain-containing protein